MGVAIEWLFEQYVRLDTQPVTQAIQQMRQFTADSEIKVGD